MKTLGEVLKLSTTYLAGQGVARPRRLVEEMLAAILKLERLQLYMQFDRPLEERELASLRGFLKRKVSGEPLEYILQEVAFFNCRFEVTPAVLIPRPETEILLDKASKLLRSQRIIWDVCCGSGCLGISLKKAFPEFEVILSDISEEALAVAKKNSMRNQAHVQFYQGDLLQPFKGQKADAVFCNPPYISEREYQNLDIGVRGFEPRGALVGGETGLEFYVRLAQELPDHLNPGARVFLEIGSGQGEAVKTLFSQKFWKESRLEKDWAGHDRFFFLEIE